MKDREKYIIVVEGQLVEVTREVYEVYYRAERKERHFMYELKAGRSRIDKTTGEKTILPGIDTQINMQVRRLMKKMESDLDFGKRPSVRKGYQPCV